MANGSGNLWVATVVLAEVDESSPLALIVLPLPQLGPLLTKVFGTVTGSAIPGESKFFFVFANLSTTYALVVLPE